jgi:hypothetical protein
MKRILFAVALISALCTTGLTQSTQTSEGLKQYVPILRSVRSNSGTLILNSVTR